MQGANKKIIYTHFVKEQINNYKNGERCIIWREYNGERQKHKYCTYGSYMKY